MRALVLHSIVKVFQSLRRKIRKFAYEINSLNGTVHPDLLMYWKESDDSLLKVENSQFKLFKYNLRSQTIIYHYSLFYFGVKINQFLKF